VTTGSWLGATCSGARVAGASTLDCTGGAACEEGASTDDGATEGISAAVDFSAGASRAAGGSGTTVVVGADGPDGPSPGFANAGAIPPVIAVNEMTIPDANTAQTVRFRHIFNGARIAHRLLRYIPRRWSPTGLTKDIDRAPDSLQAIHRRTRGRDRR
jgi:hypothetical protein